MHRYRRLHCEWREMSCRGIPRGVKARRLLDVVGLAERHPVSLLLPAIIRRGAAMPAMVVLGGPEAADSVAVRSGTYYPPSSPTRRSVHAPSELRCLPRPPPSDR